MDTVRRGVVMGFCYFCSKALDFNDDYVVMRGPDGKWIRGCADHSGVVREYERQDNQEAVVGATA